MTQNTLKIHSENILPIIKKWLYTDKEIFLRELVSNSCDAISKLKVLSEQGKASYAEDELRIDIEIDKEKKTLSITDTGIGMKEDEVEKYIAQLAFSGAEEFVKKYQSDTQKENQSQIIGHFGLGFYSSFMVSDTVAIDTLSFQENTEATHWECDGSSTYTLDKGTREKRGTTVTLHLSKESEEFLEEERLHAILLKHCRFLPPPLFLNGKQINDKKPLWMASPSECTEQDYIEFYKTLYPFEPDPIFWIHLNIDYPFHLKGILYFPKLNPHSQTQSSTVHLYSNRVFISDSCKDLLPDYLTILRGVIDSPDIPLNVSRSTLQMDHTVRQLSSHISKKVSDKLTSLYTTDQQNFINIWPDIELIIKLGILQDDKFFDRIKPCLIWKTSNDQWSTIEDYLERNQDKNANKIFYHHDEKQTSCFFDMYREKGIEILFAPSHLDTPLINLLESKLQLVKFQRLDGALDDLILDKEREKIILDSDGKTEAGKIADFIRSHLDTEKIEVEAKSLTSDQVSAFIIIDEKGRRMREYLALSGQDLPSTLTNKQTFVVNTNSSLVHSIYQLSKKDPELAKEMVIQLYELALLSQRELNPTLFAGFLKRSNEVLEKLSKHAIK